MHYIISLDSTAVQSAINKVHNPEPSPKVQLWEFELTPYTKILSTREL